MEEKLASYAHTQLPGGIYWDPPPSIQKVLNNLEPSNDICESILGLNDYLSTAIPNMCQDTRTNLVEVKKNKTFSWLDSLSQGDQGSILTLAQTSRKNLVRHRREVEKKRREHRRQVMVKHHAKTKAILQRQKKSMTNCHKSTLLHRQRSYVSVSRRSIVTESCQRVRRKLRC